MLAACGLSAGMITTVTAFIGGRSTGYTRQTTPESPIIQRYLRQMVEAGDTFAVVESTSHGLAMERVGEVAYDVAVLTNVTHEHLDLHGTIEGYVEAKASLFERLAIGPLNPGKGWPKAAVINAADQHADAFIDAARRAGARLLTYAADGRLDADLVAMEIDSRLSGLRVRVRTPRWEEDVRVELAGAYNAANILAAIGVGEALGLDPAQMREGIARVRAVPGRMERIDVGQPFDVFVDFAHTAAALELVLDTLRPVASARGGGVICVFGSSGERDVGKRPLMGRVAGLKAKASVITNEEPRGEDEMLIIEQIAAGAEAAGMRRGDTLFLIADRREAIRHAYQVARPGDIVVLCGKGHETTMETSYGSIPWDEAAIARDMLLEMGYRH
jgi:UDP-N-acetylmuramoyl-L-alanyl-D-glutamate--2,6-diaminopimelate ligase